MPHPTERSGVVVILAAGQGTRMRSPIPKVLHPLCGRPMAALVVDRALELEPRRVVVVVGAGAEPVRAALAEAAGADAERLAFAVQEPQRGTGHAVQVALGALELAADALADEDQVVVLYGDMPCLRQETLERLRAAFRALGPGGGAALLTCVRERSGGFGRIVRTGAGLDDASAPLRAIVEERDATPEQRAIREVNLGVYAFSAAALRRFLPRLSSDNAQGEQYLTDVVGMCVTAGLGVATVRIEDEREAVGVNTLAELGRARRVVQEQILEEHLAAGVLIEDPETTFIDHGVAIGAGTRILPCTVIRSGVRIGAGCEVGPFTHLRGGTALADGAEVGNFTECKNAVLGEGTKAKHLSYLGDVTIGAKANIGAGTIVANYDGREKHATHIGDRAFVGSGSILIAPARVGDDALTGGGAVVKRGSDIPDGEVWVGVPARRLRRKDEASGDA